MPEQKEKLTRAGLNPDTAPRVLCTALGFLARNRTNTQTVTAQGMPSARFHGPADACSRSRNAARTRDVEPDCAGHTPAPRISSVELLIKHSRAGMKIQTVLFGWPGVSALALVLLKHQGSLKGK